MEETPFFFWVPAFKVNAALFLTLIRRVTLFQWQGEFEQRLGTLKCHPVTLPAEEGAESLKTALADLAADKRTLLPRLGDMGIVTKEALLVYLAIPGQGRGTHPTADPAGNPAESTAVRVEYLTMPHRGRGIQLTDSGCRNPFDKVLKNGSTPS